MKSEEINNIIDSGKKPILLFKGDFYKYERYSIYYDCLVTMVLTLKRCYGIKWFSKKIDDSNFDSLKSVPKRAIALMKEKKI